MTQFEPVLDAQPVTDPWLHASGDQPRYDPDCDLLGRLLTVPVGSNAVSESGAFPKGIDLWLSHELRRAGFGDAEVWPRLKPPRVLPREIATLLDRLPVALRVEVSRRALDVAAVTPTNAVVLGRAYDKQVDVCIARWDRGPELLVSTKAMLSSFRNNLANRFEEAYGDAANLRGRYPLAATGFVFALRSTVLADQEAFERAVDMVRKLRDTGGGSGYTATALLLAEWDEDRDSPPRVRVRLDEVPADVGPAPFLATMVEHVLAVTPVVHHVEVRRRLERRDIAVSEAAPHGSAQPS